MRIGIDATALYGRFGGVEYSLWNLLDALRLEARSVTAHNDTPEYSVYIPHDGPAMEELQAFPPNWRWHRLPFRGGQKLQRIVWQQFQLPHQLRADGCDILHAPTYVLPLRNKKLRPRVPSVLTVYDIIALDEPHFATRWNRLHYKITLPRSILAADRVIVPSQQVRDAITRRLPAAREKLRVVPLGVEIMFFEKPSVPMLDEVRARYDLPDEFLLFVGNFEPKKNLENLLRALELIPDAPPIVVAGGARAWHEIESTPRVRPIGYVPRRDLPALYALCRAFLFPSLAEGFGLPVLEALSCGAPVVASRAVALPKLEDVAVLCEPHSPQSIAAAIQKVLADAKLSEQLSTAGQEYSRAFTWQRTAHATLEVYREVL